jgi:hypothetical protein
VSPEHFACAAIDVLHVDEQMSWLFTTSMHALSHLFPHLDSSHPLQVFWHNEMKSDLVVIVALSGHSATGSGLFPMFTRPVSTGITANAVSVKNRARAANGFPTGIPQEACFLF